MTEREQSHAEFIAAVKPVCEASTDRNEYRAWVALPEALERLEEAVKRIAALEELTIEVDRIRNDIIQRQLFNWSAHAYPLVAALGKAGYEGQEYTGKPDRSMLEVAVEQQNRAEAAEAERDELQKLRQIAQNWQKNERAIVEHGPSEGRERWKMETELALSLALDRLAAQEEKP